MSRTPVIIDFRLERGGVEGYERENAYSGKWKHWKFEVARTSCTSDKWFFKTFPFPFKKYFTNEELYTGDGKERGFNDIQNGEDLIKKAIARFMRDIHDGERATKYQL